MPTGKPKALAVLALLLFVLAVAFGYRVYSDPFQTPFSQEQYDEGFVSAFETNAVWGTAHICYKPEFWSMQRGYDDGLRLYRELYPEPNGYYLHAYQRLAEVIAVVESSPDFDEDRKSAVLDGLGETLDSWREDFEEKVLNSNRENNSSSQQD